MFFPDRDLVFAQWLRDDSKMCHPLTVKRSGPVVPWGDVALARRRTPRLDRRRRFGASMH
ncbi:hypothetical protein [Mumia zhuanghuii]|uniref:Uncharacterized protein n=1 Tax=Mumia zhuanghuii TaxID=2585211 RepID=A0A5C4MDL9_9ACTN|nr:hypothetical protein [Mumia zhuanghuii]TNC36450.1 hypothetical protein FHE65_26225 [Mumia zhuanghuii]